MFDAALHAFPRAVLIVAPEIPQPVQQRLRRALVEGGVCLGPTEDLFDGTLPTDTSLLALFRRPDAQLLGRLASLASRPGCRVLGVAVPAAAATSGQEPIETLWRNAGLRPEDLLLWDGVTPPALVLARLLAGHVPGPPTARGQGGCVTVTLRTGRALHVPPDVAPDLLRRLVETLER